MEAAKQGHGSLAQMDKVHLYNVVVSGDSCLTKSARFALCVCWDNFKGLKRLGRGKVLLS